MKVKKFLSLVYIFSAICLCLIALVIFDSRNTILSSDTKTNPNANNAPYEHWEGETQNANPNIKNEDGQETQNIDENQTPFALPTDKDRATGGATGATGATGAAAVANQNDNLDINLVDDGEHKNGIESQNNGNTQSNGATKPPTTPSKDNEYTGMVNLNSASFEQLCSLDGIGEVLAQRIIDYRKKIGGFKNIEEIMDVSGIAEKKFAGIKNRITV